MSKLTSIKKLVNEMGMKSIDDPRAIEEMLQKIGWSDMKIEKSGMLELFVNEKEVWGNSHYIPERWYAAELLHTWE